MIKHFKSDDSSQSLLNEEAEKATFKVLNKLTENKNFFANDLNIQELCYLLVERIINISDIQNFYIQFITNIIRNKTSEIETLLKSIVSKIFHYSFKLNF